MMIVLVCSRGTCTYLGLWMYHRVKYLLTLNLNVPTYLLAMHIHGPCFTTPFFKDEKKCISCKTDHLAASSFFWSKPVHLMSLRLSLNPKLALTCTGSPVKAAADPAGSGRQQNTFPLKKNCQTIFSCSLFEWGSKGLILSIWKPDESSIIQMVVWIAVASKQTNANQVE